MVSFMGQILISSEVSGGDSDHSILGHIGKDGETSKQQNI